MYTPNYFTIDDLELLKAFIQEYSFGTLTTVKDNQLNANHYPFLLTQEDDQLYLWTHLAKSNSQWKELQEECLVTFTGPHTYISPTYYINTPHVPTWNYTAVHAKCQGEMVTDPLLAKKLMDQLVLENESKYQTNWDYNIPEDFQQKLLKAIVWIKLKVIQIDGKFKLSQNREQKDYQSVVEHLGKNSDRYQELLNYMRLTNPFK